jgi:uncharacterized protein YdiU (UPF0061 family)
MDKFEENTVKEFDESKYEELVGKYIEYKEKEKLNKELKDIIVSEIDSLMHDDQIDYKKIFINAIGENFECKYVDRNTKKVDYLRLSEVVSDQVYNEIVSDSISTYLKIGVEKKEKKKKERPIPKAQDVKPSMLPKAKIIGVGPDAIIDKKKNPFIQGK